MSLAIFGIGTAQPSTRLSQQEALDIARVLCVRHPEEETWLPVMYGNTGISERRLILERKLVDDILAGTRASGSMFLPTGRPDDSGPTTGKRMALYAKQAGEIALRASSSALDESGLSANLITHLVIVTCTGFYAPGLDLALIEGLGLRPTVERVQVGFMGCHGAINGLRVARAFADSDPNARVLLCAVELCSLHYHYGWDPQRIVANALFGDGAAAVVAGPASQADSWKVQATGSCLVPSSADAMSWTIGEHGFEMTLSKRVPALIREHLRPWLEEWLVNAGCSLRQVRSWAVHPGGPKILSAVEQSLQLSETDLAASRAVLAECGNMSSPTLLFIVNRLKLAHAELPCVALGFGPGLTAEALLIV